MDSNIVIFNSKCSKCNKTKQYIDESSLDFEIINYLDGDLTDDILTLVYEGVDDKGSLTRDDNVLDSYTLFSEQVLKSPEILQRPIIIMGSNVFINRPAELILNHL